MAGQKTRSAIGMGEPKAVYAGFGPHVADDSLTLLGYAATPSCVYKVWQCGNLARQVGVIHLDSAPILVCQARRIHIFAVFVLVETSVIEVCDDLGLAVRPKELLVRPEGLGVRAQ